MREVPLNVANHFVQALPDLRDAGTGCDYDEARDRRRLFSRTMHRGDDLLPRLLEHSQRHGAASRGRLGTPGVLSGNNHVVKRARDRLIPALDRAAFLSRFDEAEESRTLECRDVVIQPGGRVAEEFRDLLRRSWLFGEQLEDAQAERVG